MVSTAFMGEVKKQVAVLVTTAFGLVAALFWNDAIKAMINSYIPAGNAWPYMMVSAVVVTIVAVLAIIMIAKMLKTK